ncbi:hypothetical protein HDU87_007006 [Geranomyces variabilis]|uniref:SART-1 protein n=1 Tax=Geranomyces variabilis TaxID=109894 RepID=A0AAD5XNK7_9FUNG|nr:hypothetical protein HDU87_007006 [Geranomyces variabilis]
MADTDHDAGGEVSLSIEQTNALRISLGLKPLTDSQTTDKEAQAEQNYAKHKESLANKAARQELIATVAKAKAKAQREKVLVGPTLGGAASDDDDAAAVDDPLAWVQRQQARDEKRRLKDKEKAAALARKKEMELEAMDRDAVVVVPKYKASDLKGLRVDHNLEDVLAGGESILTLKDATIAELEEEGDMLQSVNLADADRDRKNNENRRKKTAYNVYDDEEMATGTKRNILSQYDEEIDGPQSTGFVINEDGAVDLEQKRKTVSEQMRANAVALTYEKAQEIKDYYTQEEMISFKKPRKKKKSRRERQVDDDDINTNGTTTTTGDVTESAGRDHGSRRRRTRLDEDSMDVDEPSAPAEEHADEPRAMDYSKSNRNINIEDVNFVDDDDLQSALARARRVQLKKQRKTDVEDMAKAALLIKDDDSVPAGSVVVSATSEFVRNLATAPTVKAPESTRPARSARPTDEQAAQPKRNSDAMDVDGGEQDDEQGGWDVDAASGNDAAAKAPEGGDSPDADADAQSDDGELPPQAPIEEEPLISAGLGATLALLTQKGFVEKASPAEIERLRKQNERRAWLAEQKKLEKIREMAKQKEKARNRELNEKAKGKGKQQQQQHHQDDHDWYREEQEARYAERERARETEERFKKYIPDVNLEYHDEYGRKLNQKEAFRQLSHKFHGKSSGKMKTERRLRKIEDELKMEKMSSNDTPLGTASALSERTRASGAAHVVLQINNRSVLPADVSLSSLRPSKPAPTASRTQVTTTTVVDTDRNVNTFNRERVAFGLGAAPSGPAAVKPPPASSEGSSPLAKRKAFDGDAASEPGSSKKPKH